MAFLGDLKIYFLDLRDLLGSKDFFGIYKIFLGLNDLFGIYGVFLGFMRFFLFILNNYQILF